MKAVVIHKVGFLEYSCPTHGQDFKPFRTWVKFPPPGRGWGGCVYMVNPFTKLTASTKSYLSKTWWLILTIMQEVWQKVSFWYVDSDATKGCPKKDPK